MLRIRRIAAQARAVPWVPEALAEGNTLRRLVYGLAAQRLPGWLAGYSTGGIALT